MTNGTNLLLVGILLALLSGLWLVWLIARRTRKNKYSELMHNEDVLGSTFPRGIDLNATIELYPKPKSFTKPATSNFRLIYNEVVVHSLETIE